MLQTKTLPIAGLRQFSLLFAAMVFVAVAALAQPGTSYVTNQQQNRNFSDADLWVGGVVPSAGASVTIVNSTVTMDVDISLGTLTLSSGYLSLATQTLTITDQFINNSLNGVVPATSTVILNSTVADNNSGQVTVGGTNDVTFYNVVIPTGSVVDFDSGGTTNTETYITNQLKMDGGSVVVNPPIYGAASTLLYDDTHTSIGTEWTAGASSGKGVPHHVTVGAGSSLDFSSTSDSYTCTGDFTVDGASASLDVADMTGTLTVDGNLSLGTSSAVSLTLPSAEGASKIVVGGDLTFGANTTITGDEANLEVRGNLANSVTGAAFGLLKMNGSADQDVTGSKITVDSLVVSNTQNAVTDDTDVDFQADVDITPGGVFNPIDGTAKITGTFTMNSDATGTARIATLADDGSTSDVDGDITFERYIPADAGVTWLSSGNYVVGATLGDWSSSFGSDFFLTFQWDETHILNNSESSNGASWWSTITGDATTLEDSDYGYYILTMPNSSPTLTATGGYNSAQVDLNLTLSAGAFENGGWHLLTNPFPCPIDGTEFLADNSGRVSAYQLYNNTTDVFTISGATAPGTIDVGQSFWVQVGSAGTVSFELDQLTHGTNSFVRTEDALEEAFIGLRIEQPDGKFGQTFIRFHQNGTPAYEWEHDVTFKNSGDNSNPEVYSQLDNGHQLAVNSPGAISETEIIPIVVEAGAEGTVSLMLDEEFTLPSGLCMLIQDTETGDKAGLGGEPLAVELEPFTIYTDRFQLVVMSAPEFEATASHCEGGVVHFNGTDAGLWDIEWSDTEGSIDGTGCVTGLDAGEYIFEASNPLNQCFTMSNITIPSVCMGDFNLNGERDITDLLILLVGIQPVENFEGTFPETDCDCDGAMTTLDLLMFLPTFGAICD